MNDELPRPSWWWRWLSAGVLTLFLIGLLLRLTITDRVPYLATLFYALPLPVLTSLSVLQAGLSRRWRHRRAGRLWGIVTLLMIVWCAIALGRWHPQSANEGDTVRVMCWNTCRGALGWSRVANVINDVQPDVAGLVEAGEWSESRRAFWEESCPGYHVSMLGGEFVCLTKEPPGIGHAVMLPSESEYRQLDVTANGQRMTLLIVDIDAEPLRPRGPTLDRLAADVDRLSDRPVIVMGDFNTPAESVHFDGLRIGHRHAFETSGRGVLPTWPLPLPVLCLDHIWVNDRVAVHGCRHLWTSASDHRPVIAEVTVTADVSMSP